MVKYRKNIQFVFAFAIIIGLSYDLISLVTLLIIGTLSGVIFGKVFCKWMCPMGFIMELMKSKMSDEELKVNMYNYYKVGCPISWIQGVTNKFSFFKIKVNKDKCTSCGICDDTCYITSINKENSFYKEDSKLPGEAFNCSKCLQCVSVCPSKSINFSIGK